jgi:hypothetical protein
MEECRIARHVAEWNPQGKSKHGRSVSTWKNGIRDTVQRRNIKGEYFDRELWEKKKLYLYVEENCVFIEKILQ